MIDIVVVQRYNFNEIRQDIKRAEFHQNTILKNGNASIEVI